MDVREKSCPARSNPGNSHVISAVSAVFSIAIINVLLYFIHKSDNMLEDILFQSLKTYFSFVCG